MRNSDVQHFQSVGHLFLSEGRCFSKDLTDIWDFKGKRLCHGCLSCHWEKHDVQVVPYWYVYFVEKMAIIFPTSIEFIT